MLVQSGEKKERYLPPAGSLQGYNQSPTTAPLSQSWPQLSARTDRYTVNNPSCF